jgi:hypothetical protein
MHRPINLTFLSENKSKIITINIILKVTQWCVSESSPEVVSLQLLGNHDIFIITEVRTRNNVYANTVKLHIVNKRNYQTLRQTRNYSVHSYIHKHSVNLNGYDYWIHLY